MSVLNLTLEQRIQFEKAEYERQFSPGSVLSKNGHEQKQKPRATPKQHGSKANISRGIDL